MGLLILNGRAVGGGDAVAKQKAGRVTVLWGHGPGMEGRVHL